MDDLISRQAAIKAMRRMYDADVDELIVELESLPPVEPERPKGEWIEYIDDRNGRRYCKCSSCNKSTLNAVEYDVLDGERHIMDYCPNCGCRMTGGRADGADTPQTMEGTTTANHFYGREGESK